ILESSGRIGVVEESGGVLVLVWCSATDDLCQVGGEIGLADRSCEDVSAGSAEIEDTRRHWRPKIPHVGELCNPQLGESHSTVRFPLQKFAELDDKPFQCFLPRRRRRAAR